MASVSPSREEDPEDSPTFLRNLIDRASTGRISRTIKM